MNIAIIDDNPNEAFHLRTLLESWFQKAHLSLELTAFNSGEDFLELQRCGDFDLVFFDIYMTGMNGIETAQRFRNDDRNALIVFLTTSTDHVWEAFQVHPFDYLVKPCSEEKLAHLLEEAVKTLPHIGQSLEFSLERQKINVLYDDIHYLIADGHYVRLFAEHISDARCYISSFKQLWEELEKDSRFVLSNRGIIINMEYIEKMNGDSFIMKDGERLPIRQSNRNEVLQTFVSFQYMQARKYAKKYWF